MKRVHSKFLSMMGLKRIIRRSENDDTAFLQEEAQDDEALGTDEMTVEQIVQEAKAHENEYNQRTEAESDKQELAVRTRRLLAPALMLFEQQMDAADAALKKLSQGSLEESPDQDPDFLKATTVS